MKPAAPTVDSPDAAETLRRALDQFEPAVRDRGARYFREHRVSQIARDGERAVEALVRGSSLYTVAWSREGAGWTSACTCPMSWGCKHAFAAGLAWLGHLSRHTRVHRTHTDAPAPAVSTPAPSQLSFRQQWEPILAAKLGRALTPEEGAFLGQLATVFHNFRQSGRVAPLDLARLGVETAAARRPPYANAYADWWVTPPHDPLELWQFIAHDLESSGLPVPEFMRPLTDTRAARDLVENRDRRETIQRWMERFERLATAATNIEAPDADSASATPATLELRLLLGSSKWSLETRTRPEAPWKPAPRTFLERFANETASGLASLDLAPAVLAFLAVCHDHYERTYSLALSPGTLSARELLHRLLSHRLARTLVFSASGQPLTFSPAPVAWQLDPSASAPADYEIALRLPDGRALPPAALHLPGKPELYVHDNTVFAGPPALDGISATAAIVPAEVLEDPKVLRTLHRLGARLPAVIAERFVAVPLRPRLTCALEIDFSENEILTVQLEATSAQPPTAAVWQPGRWVDAAAADGRVDASLKSDPPRNANAEPSRTIVSFDYAVADAVAQRLPELGVTFDPPHLRWVRRVTKTFPEEFIAWRESLPPGAEVLATGELASLLEAPVRAHVEFALSETTTQRDWFDLALALKPEDTTLTPAELALLLKARGKLVRLPGKGWRRLSVELDAAPAAALEATGLDADSIATAALAGERHRFHALQLASTGVADLLPERQAAALRARARTIAEPPPPEIPAGLRAELRPYQREGFRFLAFLSTNALGGILADDMGLGKTLQALAWLLWLAERQPAGEPLRALVVCPKSVVGNWEAEIARFAPSLSTERYSPESSAVSSAGSHSSGAPHVVLANYTQLRLNADFFQAQRWHAAILDEAQFIKNPTAKVAQVARDLPAAHRLILTGTPIENRLLDLWSLFAFAMPGLLGPQAVFKRLYAQDQPLALARLRTRVRHFLLRRTKAQVASDLPARTEEDVTVELEGEQARLYTAELKRARAQLLKVDTPRALDRARFNILASLMRLRQICCHPALIDPAHRAAPSAKLDELIDRVEELRDEGHQVLVFSQFVTMLEIIRERLTAAGIEHLLLTGQTENRDELVAQFQADRTRTVFLLSLKAAGFGLNLTAASYVILYDPWWNPAVEAQAIDRTHRIGQSQPVNAYRLIARGTVEEKIRALQKEKASLASAIVQEESLASVLDLESLRTILG